MKPSDDVKHRDYSRVTKTMTTMTTTNRPTRISAVVAPGVY